MSDFVASSGGDAAILQAQVGGPAAANTASASVSAAVKPCPPKTTKRRKSARKGPVAKPVSPLGRRASGDSESSSPADESSGTDLDQRGPKRQKMGAGASMSGPPLPPIATRAITIPETLLLPVCRRCLQNSDTLMRSSPSSSDFSQPSSLPYSDTIPSIGNLWSSTKPSLGQSTDAI